ncbi:MAG TPA: Flp pilus assembly protein CpaB [Candidatus Krumholzibacteria bacterium]|nr:Flp pilus assembly protein CpaB [Candidatus Krumholzibacteria bacterium]
MDKKGIAFLVLALVLASLAASGVYLYLKGTPAAEAQAPETVPVVVASKDLTFGTTLKEEHLRVVEFPKESVPNGSYSAVDSVLNQTTKVFVVEGEPILASKLSAIGGGLSVRIPSDMRAMSLKVNEVTGVSGFVLPGDRVDALVTIDNAAGTSNAVTKTILQDLEVLASGVKTETKNNQNVSVQTVTVLVDPDGAEKMALAVDQGSVHLALRNPVDRGVTTGATVDTRSVLGLNSQRRAAPVRRSTTVTNKQPVPVESNTFTVIRDGKISKQESPTNEKKNDN